MLQLLAAGAASLSPFLAQEVKAKPSGGSYQDFWHKPRVLTLYRKETGERGDFEYWRDGEIQLQAWYGILHLLRDVRADVALHYDPKVVDIVWAVQEWVRLDTGKRHIFRLTDGSRTEQTNKNIEGAAAKSLHLQGKAIDGSFDGLGLRAYAQAAKFFNMGGIGLYAAHVHVDTGRVRQWGSPI